MYVPERVNIYITYYSCGNEFEKRLPYWRSKFNDKVIELTCDRRTLEPKNLFFAST